MKLLINGYIEAWLLNVYVIYIYSWTISMFISMYPFPWTFFDCIYICVCFYYIYSWSAAAVQSISSASLFLSASFSTSYSTCLSLFCLHILVYLMYLLGSLSVFLLVFLLVYTTRIFLYIHISLAQFLVYSSVCLSISLRQIQDFLFPSLYLYFSVFSFISLCCLKGILQSSTLHFHLQSVYLFTIKD